MRKFLLALVIVTGAVIPVSIVTGPARATVTAQRPAEPLMPWDRTDEPDAHHIWCLMLVTSHKWERPSDIPGPYCYVNHRTLSYMMVNNTWGMFGHRVPKAFGYHSVLARLWEHHTAMSSDSWRLYILGNNNESGTHDPSFGTCHPNDPDYLHFWIRDMPGAFNDAVSAAQKINANCMSLWLFFNADYNWDSSRQLHELHHLCYILREQIRGQDIVDLMNDPEPWAAGINNQMSSGRIDDIRIKEEDYCEYPINAP